MPDKLSQDYEFSFDGKFEELNISTKDGKTLNGILFKAQNPKGLVFYLHGNSGSLKLMEVLATPFIDLNYDVFIFDYRGFGKSEGKITSQKQFYLDNQLVYNRLLEDYDEEKVIILGLSIGSGPSAKLALENNPLSLILFAPYYNLTDLLRHTYPGLPGVLLKYKFKTNKFIQLCNMPIYLFHGDNDNTIYYGSSVKLKEIAKDTDRLITLKGQDHNPLEWDSAYIKELEIILH